MAKLVVDAAVGGYGKHDVLRGVTFRVAAGEFVGCIGPNGAGKSTLIKTVSGVLPLRSGCIRVDGVDIASLTYQERARRIAVVSQSLSVGFAYRAEDIVRMGRYCRRPQERQSVQTFMEWTGVWELRERKFYTLSGGERQRVLISQALAQEAELLLLDEPVSDLDIFRQVEVFELMEWLRQKKGITVLAILHDLNLAALYCDRIIAVKNGTVYGSGHPNQVLNEDNLRRIFGAETVVLPRGDCDRPVVLPKKKGGKQDE